MHMYGQTGGVAHLISTMEVNPVTQAAENLLALSARSRSIANARSTKDTTNDRIIVPMEGGVELASIDRRERGFNECADFPADWPAQCTSSFGSNDDSVQSTDEGREPPARPVHFKYSGYNLFVKVCMSDILKHGRITKESYRDTDIIDATWEEMKKTGRLAESSGRHRAYRKRRHKNTMLRKYGNFANLAKDLGIHWKEVKTNTKLRCYYTSLVSSYKQKRQACIRA